MEGLTITLFERLGLLLIMAFVMTRTPGLSRCVQNTCRNVCRSCGCLGVVRDRLYCDRHCYLRRRFHQSPLLTPVPDGQFIVSLRLVAVVLAGLRGGPALGVGAGFIAGMHLFFLGGDGAFANAVSNPLTGLLAGFTARFFSNERVISPLKALFIGVFPPVLHMQLLLMMNTNHAGMVAVVDKIGFPLVLTISTATAIFTAMIGIVLKEQENEAALASEQALTIAKEALPYLKKDSLLDVAAGLLNCCTAA